MKSINEIYNLVSETLLLETRSLEEIFEKYYSNDKDINLSLETFKSINLIDPTGSASKRGKYLDWLIRKAYKQNSRLLEDVDKIKEDLELFDKNYRHINKQITQIKDQYELASLVEEFREKKEKGEIDLSRSEIKKDVEKIYEDSDWLILTPKTEEAAKYYGKNTRWCTAAENDNYFDEYNKDGSLYILINKKVPDEKYQFHFQGEQYMDSEDNRISCNEYNQFPKKVLDKLIELAKKNNGLVEFIMTLPNYTIEKYKKIYLKEYRAYELGLQLASLKYRDNPLLLEQIKELVEKGANVSVNNEYALRHAAYFGHAEVVKYLAEHGANIRIEGDFPLKDAITNQHFEIVKYLVEKGADIHADNDYALRYAVEKGNFDMVQYLVENGANVQADNDIALRYAVANGHLDVVKYLVEKGADIHARDDYALRYAAYSGHLEIVKYSVEKGADVHAEDDYALRYAAYNGHLDVVKYLVEKGANIHAEDDEALINAAHMGHLEIVKYLVEKGANIHTKDDHIFVIAHEDKIKEYLQSIVDKEKQSINNT